MKGGRAARLCLGAWLLACGLALAAPARAQAPTAAAPQTPSTAPRAAVASVPFELTSTNHVLFQARVGDSAPLWFLLDSGASVALIVDERRAAALRLRPTRRGTISGAGARPVPYGVLPPAAFSLGGLTLERMPLFSMPLAEVESFLGRPFEGVVGYELFRRYVVEVDYAARAFRLHDPRGFTYTGRGVELPMEATGSHFFVRATVEFPDGKAVEARLMLDTGAHVAVLLNSPLVDEDDLLRSAPKLVRDPYSPGLGGELSFYVGRARAVRLGGLELKGVAVGLSRDKAGALADPHFDGIIGGELLRRFTAIFDSSRSRLILEPNAHLAEAYVYANETSGLGLRADGPGFDPVVVHRVAAGSPAEQAGLREGDRVVAVGGRPASALGLDGVRRALKGPGEHALTVERAGARREVKLNIVDPI